MKQMHNIYVRFSESADSEQALLTRPELFLCQTAGLCKKDLRSSALCPLKRYKSGIQVMQDSKLEVPALHVFFYFVIQMSSTRLQDMRDRRQETRNSSSELFSSFNSYKSQFPEKLRIHSASYVDQVPYDCMYFALQSRNNLHIFINIP